jgi:ATP-dependent DNA helicase RecG
VYPETVGVTSRWFYHAAQKVFAVGVHKNLEDPLPQNIRKKYNLPDLASALIWLHVPEKLSHTESARKRFAFEEIFVIQAARAVERVDNDSQKAFTIPEASERVETFLGALDVAPTGAQKRAIGEIISDFAKPHPMARLLEGDVGSGKTLVAAATAYAAVTSRPPLKLASGEFGRTPEGVLARRKSGTLQVAYMAPTEILAQQHFESFIKYFRHLPINIALVTGSGCKKFPSKVHKDRPTSISRSQLLKWVENGEIAMVVGTHALIQKKVEFQHLAYAIVDEQHRFGTKQRRALAHKATKKSSADDGGPNSSETSFMAPHFLSMTATPIPRTLALTLYGDLDISVLDELPPGRAKITTKVLQPKERNIAYEKMREELEKGRQVYVICPRIDEPDPAKMNAVQAKSAKAEAGRIQKDIFPDFEVGLLHGAMRPAEKEKVMTDFMANKIQILVATSVVEVGVNVPNATVILIEGAERFGMAQLHQLRGRVMRSSHPPFCFLLAEHKGEMSAKRLRAMEKSDNGFALAEADLETRGAGDLYGRRQWGVSDIGMDALKNPRLIQAAREEAFKLVGTDPQLSGHVTLRERVLASANEMHSE